jgi:hypothetical protein
LSGAAQRAEPFASHRGSFQVEAVATVGVYVGVPRGREVGEVLLIYGVAFRGELL